MPTRAEWAKEGALWLTLGLTVYMGWSLLWTLVCFVFNPIWTILSDVPVVYWKDPLFQSGNTNLDNLLALSVYFITIIVTLEIATVLCKAKTLAVEEEENILPKQRKVNWKAFKYWIVAAVAITILVNLQRYEHRQLKLKFFEMLGEKQRGEEWYKESKVRKYFPGFLKGLFDDGIHPHFYAKVPRSLSHRFPHMPADSSRAASWKRNIDRSIAADFMLVGYTMSLAGAQCLFFALLLVYPKRAGRKTRLKSIYLVTSTFAEGLLLVVVPWVLVWEEKRRADWLPGTHWTFMIVQGLLFFTPLFVLRSEAVISPGSRVITGRSSGGEKSRELDVKKLWHALSIIAIVLHILGTYFAFAEVNRDSWWGHSNGWPRQVNWFAPWRNESDAAAQEFKQVGVSIFETLGDHPWINALGWDVWKMDQKGQRWKLDQHDGLPDMPSSIKIRKRLGAELVDTGCLSGERMKQRGYLMLVELKRIKACGHRRRQKRERRKLPV
ncbi:hypothetical protein PRZ48_002853 [Zasmidium cellare]|uniref:Uncharacterized protein n=1 Tax=Zasmidium cellare TaxID=395010 RepID=A0ABR0ETU3_ZASCE|nr:hypothetical protein PRZ48_002853 [Zasmidium cellare]